MNIWTHVHANLPMCIDSQNIRFKDKQNYAQKNNLLNKQTIPLFFIAFK